MTVSEQKAESHENSAVSNIIELGNKDDGTILDDVMVGENKKKEREQREV